MKTVYLFCLIFLALIISLGCRSRPFESVVRGIMTMDGKMQMDGDMRMDGAMDMSGEVSTVMRTDNRTSRLTTVPVYASSSQPSAAEGTVAVIDIDGLLINKNLSGFGSLGENPVALFREKLDAIACDPGVAAIVLRINSPGGGVTAADVMTRDLLQVKQQRNLPVVACLMDVGAGGGYYIATAADAIVAHPTSLVGGVGVILNAYNMEDGMAQFGIVSIPVKSGERIDIASPERIMEQEEREHLQGIADSFHRRFVARVNQTRPRLNPQIQLDGRVVTGNTALADGLVDQLGYLDDAVVRARELANLSQQSSVVMLRRENDRAYTLMDVTPNTPTTSSIIPIKFPGLDRSTLPTFLYLWQPDSSWLTASGG